MSEENTEGFWEVMPPKTKIAFLAFFFAKFFCAPAAIVGTMTYRPLGGFFLFLYGFALLVSVGFAISEMFGEKHVPSKEQVLEWAKHYGLDNGSRNSKKNSSGKKTRRRKRKKRKLYPMG